VSYRIHLSPPDVGDAERHLLLDAFDSNWIAPLGPHVDAFEEEVATRLDAAHAVALSSGTAALHLALLCLGVGPGDEVILPSLTFAATANAVTYVGATPVFVDSESRSWNLDPELVDEELRTRSGRVAAVITVDLYGQCADYDSLVAICADRGVPLVEDAAEAIGATWRGRAAGTFGRAGVLSFNGNKMITTGGGGMLVTDDGELAHQARYLASQARDPAPHYEHNAVGYNYRLSNLLAAVGRGQLQGLDDKIARRRQINARYREALGDLPGLTFAPVAAHSGPNFWLSCLTVDAGTFGLDREGVRTGLVVRGIEARPVWKPMHLQPIFAGAAMRGGEVCEDLFARGLCLPSGSSLGADEQAEVIDVVHELHHGR
jgi:dTDP-4-amino-4,6-dideoxygalactose transaminase